YKEKKSQNNSSQRKEDLSENKVFRPLKEILTSLDKISEFEVVQESFVKRLETISSQKLEMQIDSIISPEQNNKTTKSYNASITSLQSNTDTGVQQKSQSTSEEIKKKTYSTAVSGTKSKQQKTFEAKRK
ncbi:41845_t:CDS:2, partial [Gigaspora margarita]